MKKFIKWIWSKGICLLELWKKGNVVNERKETNGGANINISVNIYTKE